MNPSRNYGEIAKFIIYSELSTQFPAYLKGRNSVSVHPLFNKSYFAFLSSAANYLSLNFTGRAI